nr:hypothetical protein [uncultured bacterium]
MKWLSCIRGFRFFIFLKSFYLNTVYIHSIKYCSFFFKGSLLCFSFVSLKC